MRIQIDPESPATLRLEFSTPLSFDHARGIHDALEPLPGVERVVVGRYLAHVTIARHVVTLPQAADLVVGALNGEAVGAEAWFDRVHMDEYERRVAQVVA